MKKFKEIKKIIIPAAGWGTRFIPLTKVVEKELIPILNKPIIDYLVKEIVDSNINEIIFVISKRKKNIKKYFERNIRLEKELIKKNKNSLYKKLIETNASCKITIIYQRKQLGLGHAILAAHKKIKNDEPFGVILGDDLINSKTPAIKQLINAYNKTGSTILGSLKIKNADVSKYGILSPKNKSITSSLFEINGAIEKPSIKDAPSNFAIVGRYIFNSEIMNILKKIKIEKGKELNVVDAFPELMKTQKIYALNIKGERYDIGTKKGFSLANIDYSLKDSEIKKDIYDHIKKIK